MKLPDKMDIAIEWPRLDQGGLRKLEQYAEDHSDLCLVVIDTLAKVRKKETGNANAYASDYDVGSQLKQLSDKYRIAIVVVTHVRKAESLDPLEMVSGTLGLTGGMDGVMVLKRERGKDQASLYVTGRDVPEDGYYALSWNKQTCRWTIEGDAKEIQISDARKAILDVLARGKRPLSAREIADTSGRKHDATRRLLPDMVKDGLVDEIKDGQRWLYVHPLYNSASKGDTSHPNHSTNSSLRAHRPPTPHTPGRTLPALVFEED